MCSELLLSFRHSFGYYTGRTLPARTDGQHTEGTSTKRRQQTKTHTPKWKTHHKHRSTRCVNVEIEQKRWMSDDIASLILNRNRIWLNTFGHVCVWQPKNATSTQGVSCVCCAKRSQNVGEKPQNNECLMPIQMHAGPMRFVLHKNKRLNVFVFSSFFGSFFIPSCFSFYALWSAHKRNRIIINNNMFYCGCVCVCSSRTR